MEGRRLLNLIRTIRSDPESLTVCVTRSALGYNSGLRTRLLLDWVIRRFYSAMRTGHLTDLIDALIIYQYTTRGVKHGLDATRAVDLRFR